MSGPRRESPLPEEPDLGRVGDRLALMRRVVADLIPYGPEPPGAPSSVAAGGGYATFFRRA